MFNASYQRTTNAYGVIMNCKQILDDLLFMQQYYTHPITHGELETTFKHTSSYPTYQILYNHLLNHREFNRKDLENEIENQLYLLTENYIPEFLQKFKMFRNNAELKGAEYYRLTFDNEGGRRAKMRRLQGSIQFNKEDKKYEEKVQKIEGKKEDDDDEEEDEIEEVQIEDSEDEEEEFNEEEEEEDSRRILSFMTLNEHPKYEISTTYPYIIRKKKTGKIMKTYTNALGYVYLSIDGKSQPLHYIVAEQFVQCPKDEFSKFKVQHVNKNKQDNRPENLRWVLRSGYVMTHYGIQPKVSLKDYVPELGQLKALSRRRVVAPAPASAPASAAPQPAPGTEPQ